jgi:hypothetical protein
MPEERWTLRTWFMILLAGGITIMLIMGCTTLWKHNLRESILFFTLAGVPTWLFYRKKLVLLAVGACAFIVVNAGLTAVFHPSVLGISVSLASLAGLIFFCCVLQKQYPNLPPDEWQHVFDKETNQ